MLNTNAAQRKLVKWPVVHVKTGKSRTQVWRDVRTADFPAPVQIGPNSVAWFEDEVDAWLADRPRVSYALKPSTPKRNSTEPLQSAERSAPAGVASRFRKARAPIKRAPQEHRGPSEVGGADPMPQTSPSPPMPNAPRDNVSVVMEHFLVERTRLWPDTSISAAAIEKLHAEAEVLLHGSSVSKLISTLSDQMTLAASKDRPAPISMRSVTSGSPFAAARERAKATHQ